MLLVSVMKNSEWLKLSARKKKTDITEKRKNKEEHTSNTKKKMKIIIADIAYDYLFLPALLIAR